MNRLLTLLLLVLGVSVAQAATHTQAWHTDIDAEPALATVADQLRSGSVDDFLSLTPKKVREMTGERLGIKGTLALKAAQKAVKKQMKKGSRDADISQGLYVVMAIFGLGWLAMGLMDDFEGNNWWVNLLLTICLFGIGGLIHALIKMNDYY